MFSFKVSYIFLAVSTSYAAIAPAKRRGIYNQKKIKIIIILFLIISSSSVSSSVLYSKGPFPLLYTLYTYYYYYILIIHIIKFVT